MWGLLGTPAWGAEYLRDGIEISVVTGKPVELNEDVIGQRTVVSDGEGERSLDLD